MMERGRKGIMERERRRRNEPQRNRRINVLEEGRNMRMKLNEEGREGDGGGTDTEKGRTRAYIFQIKYIFLNMKYLFLN